MKNNIKNLTSGKEKLVKYAVMQVEITDNEVYNRSFITNIFCDKHNIFDNEQSAQAFCDHTNNTEKYSYKWIVQKIVVDCKWSY